MAFIIISMDQEHRELCRVLVITNEEELNDRIEDGSLQAGDTIYQGEKYGGIKEVKEERKLELIRKNGQRSEAER